MHLMRRDLVSMRYDLEDRLVSYCGLIIDVVDALPSNRACNHIAGQMIRSGTSPAFSHGEAQSGESRRDFIHKMKVGLKELRETRIGLKVVHLKKYLPESTMQNTLKETEELIAIFAKSISTAKANLKKFGS